MRKLLNVIDNEMKPQFLYFRFDKAAPELFQRVNRGFCASFVSLNMNIQQLPRRRRAAVDKGRSENEAGEMVRLCELNTITAFAPVFEPDRASRSSKEGSFTGGKEGLRRPQPAVAPREDKTGGFAKELTTLSRKTLG